MGIPLPPHLSIFLFRTVIYILRMLVDFQLWHPPWQNRGFATDIICFCRQEVPKFYIRDEETTHFLLFLTGTLNQTVIAIRYL